MQINPSLTAYTQFLGGSNKHSKPSEQAQVSDPRGSNEFTSIDQIARRVPRSNNVIETSKKPKEAFAHSKDSSGTRAEEARQPQYHRESVTGKNQPPRYVPKGQHLNITV